MLFKEIVAVNNENYMEVFKCTLCLNYTDL